MERRKIVFVTPVRNEEWILHRFLKVSSELADRIIVAYQESQDNTLQILESYPKVEIVENPQSNYDEISRVKLLIDSARRLVPEEKVIFAPDADEIFSADTPDSDEWKSIHSLPLGTVIYMDNPDLVEGTRRCVRGYIKPFGFVDDGAEVQTRLVHSLRVPTPNGANKVYWKEATLLHYNSLRKNACRAKRRMYCVIENTNRTMSLLRRLRVYGNLPDTPIPQAVKTHDKWFKGWEQKGVEMHKFEDPEFGWWDFEVLRHFATYGERRFWLDDIWDLNWERARQWALNEGYGGIPSQPISVAPRSATLLRGLLRSGLRVTKNFRQ